MKVKMGNVLLIKGRSQYDAMRQYIDEIEMGFRLSGYNTIILDIKEESFDFQLEELKKSVRIEYIFTCNGILTEKGNILEGFSGAPVMVTYLCDHPVTHKDRLKRFNEEAIVFCCDALHLKYLKEHFPNIKNAAFIPLSGSYSKKYVPYKERKNEVVFTGSYWRPRNYYNKMNSYFNDNEKIFAEKLVEDVLNHPKEPLETCLSRILKQADMGVSKEAFHELMYIFYNVDSYARAYYRDKIIRMLVENGIRVHVYGNGWEDFESSQRQNLIIEKGNSYVAQKAVAKAKISLNMMPWFKAGFQERIAAAMLSGTVAVTDESSYISENFTDGKDLVVYSLEHLEELPAKIKSLLADDEMAGAIADRGKERAENELTWQHRTFQMIEFIEKCDEREVLNQGRTGNVLQIPYQNLNKREIAIDAIKGIDEILNMIEQLRTYDSIDLCDIRYLYTKFLFFFLRIRANFPEIQISDFVYEYLMGLTEENLHTGVELLMMECTNIQSLFLNAEYKILKTENAKNKTDTKKQTNTVQQPDAHSQEVLVRKMLKNYGESQEKDIQEILKNISERRCVGPYNQNFVFKYGKTAQRILNEVCYDAEAGMHYVNWHGKKMYYPKGHSREYIATQVNFVNLEQDMESPHRYLTEDFDVCEGDVVIDAGVAEGNFALDVVERVKKIYLVECKSEWVEALKRTFAPWEEKVVIIEKMLGCVDDDMHASIDHFVEEDEVNFIKMDVEGAEVESLNGAFQTLQRSGKIKCAICAYHRRNAERDIKTVLEKHGFYTASTRGYIFFKEDMDSWVDGELRRGIVRGIKMNGTH